MWTESRYPNNAALMARPLLLSVASAEAEPRVGCGACDRSTAGREQGSELTSGGKVTPADGQEHPRPKL